MSEDQHYGGLTSVLLTKIMGDLGITQEMIDKVKTIIDNVDIQQDEDKTTIQVKTKKMTIIISK